jgi:DNA-binding NtrC family response regulator
MSEQVKILFVDDEPKILESLELVFRDMPIRIATSGEEALKIMQSEEIGVIVSDQRMPKMLGVDLLREVRRLSPLTIRILLTGYSDLEQVIDSINSGEVYRYINKPWDNAKLRETVQLATRMYEQQKELREMTKSSKSGVSAPATASAVDAPKVDTPAVDASVELLFVDKNYEHLRGLKELFSPVRPTHVTADVDEGYHLLATRPIGVVVSDVLLNGFDGADFLAVAKEKFPDVVTIMMTSSKDSSVAVRLINEGQIFRYIVKPFPKESVVAVIEEALQRHAAQKQNPMQNLKRQEQQAVAASTPAPSLTQLLDEVRQRLSEKKTY